MCVPELEGLCCCAWGVLIGLLQVLLIAKCFQAACSMGPLSMPCPAYHNSLKCAHLLTTSCPHGPSMGTMLGPCSKSS